MMKAGGAKSGHHDYVKIRNHTALLSLACAGALWGLTVPLSKLALPWLGPGWLTVVRFAAAAPLLAFAGRRGLRAALTPRVALAGALGFGAVIVLQNLGIEHTSVSHAAVIVGAVPVLVALIAAGLGRGAARPISWAGYAVALAGVALVAHGSGGGATPLGDLLVLGSVVLSAAFIVGQPQLLAGRDAAAVTAVQFAAGALVALPVALLTGPTPVAPPHAGPALALVALTLAGTLAPFWLFAYGQARVPAELAGAFVNLEPVVGATVGWLAFSNPAAGWQVAGALAVLAGIALSALPENRSAATTEWLRARIYGRAEGQDPDLARWANRKNRGSGGGAGDPPSRHPRRQRNPLQRGATGCAGAAAHRGCRADRDSAGDDEGRRDEGRPGDVVPRRWRGARGVSGGVPA
jgi:O-acetylserine/cysteine efflux transporter